MTRRAAAYRTALRQAEFRARRRAERGRAAHNRLKDPDVRRLFDPRTATMLCRLSPHFLGELTSLQIEAGKLVARVYGEYHRATGQPRRSCASPYYERPFAGRPELHWSDRRRAQVKKRYARLQDIFGTLASSADIARARAVVETLCVDNLPIPAAYLADAAVMLDRIAAAFKLAKSARPTAPRVRRLFDARIETTLCRLSPDFSDELTSLQVEAGKLVARVYGEYHRATGQPRRSCASPDYERAFAGRSEMYRSDEHCARAEKRYTRLQDIFGTLATPADIARARAVLERLCVDNLPIDAAHLPGVAVMLDRIAAAFDMFESG